MPENICQIAISVTDAKRSIDFYSELLDLRPVFGTKSFRGARAEMVQGIPGAASCCHWLIGERSFFQFEIFEFESPSPKPLLADHSITDIGYNRLIFAVRNMESICAQLQDTHYELLSGPGPRHALINAPDGILVELVEDTTLLDTTADAKLVGLGLTTPDLATSVEDFTVGLGFEQAGDPFEHRHFWSCENQLKNTLTLKQGDMHLVLSEYQASRPRSEGYQLSDIGIMNLAMGFGSRKDFYSRLEKTQNLGFTTNCKPINVGKQLTVVYNNDRQGFSVEMLHCETKLFGLVGFRKPSLLDRLLNYLQERKAFKACKAAQ